MKQEREGKKRWEIEEGKEEDGEGRGKRKKREQRSENVVTNLILSKCRC
jgi:hypothetical protein